MTQALEAWGSVSEPRPFHAGRSRLWRVTLEGGQWLARQHGESEASLRWLDRAHAAAERAGIVVPRLRLARNGCFGVGGWTLEPLLEGRAAGPAGLARLAPLCARSHRLTRRFPDRPGHKPMARRLQVAIDPAWFPTARMAAVHGDLHAGNLIRLGDGRIALVDWEEARRDDVGFNDMRPRSVLHAANETAACWRAEPARARRMVRQLQLMSGHIRPGKLALTGAGLRQ